MAENYLLKRQESPAEDDFVAGEMHPLIPEGTYQVCCIKIERGTSHYKTLKMFLKFKIVELGEHMGKELFMAMNLIDTKTGKPFKKVPKGTKYFKQWVIANKSIFPKRNDRMSPKIFQDSVFEAVVKTVKPKFEDGTEMPESFHYSKVDYLKRKIA